MVLGREWAQLEQEVQALLRRAELLDAQEDRRYGKRNRRLSKPEPGPTRAEMPMVLWQSRQLCRERLSEKRPKRSLLARRQSRLPNSLARSHPIWIRWRLTPCPGGVWRGRPTTRPRARPRGMSRIPTATSCNQAGPICRATTDSWPSIAITR